MMTAVKKRQYAIISGLKLKFKSPILLMLYAIKTDRGAMTGRIYVISFELERLKKMKIAKNHTNK